MSQSLRQVMCRVEPELATNFKEACAHRGGMQVILERFIDLYVRHEHDGSAYHLDGHPCPISEMLNAISATVRADLEARRRP